MYDGIDESTMNHMPYLEKIAADDVAVIRQKEATYKGSWRRNGGSHAWHMIKRKMDRLMTMLAGASKEDRNLLQAWVKAYPGHAKERDQLWPAVNRLLNGDDIFMALDEDISGADGTPLAEVQDLRRYLLLVEARMLAEAELRKGKISGNVIKESITISRDMVTDAPLPVPVEDSNRHADRINGMDAKAGVYQPDGTWRVQPVIAAEWLPHLSPDLAARFVRTGGKYAVVDRRQYPDTELGIKFLFKFHTTLPNHEWDRLAMWEKELYEPRTGVENEMQLKELFRSHHWSM